MRKVTIGSFCLILNEINFIKAHLDAWLPYLDQMVFINGDSTDGTTEILESYSKKNDKIIVKYSPRKNLQEDYVLKNNTALHSLETDLAIYIHPDMFPVNGEVLKDIPEGIISATTHMRSFAGEYSKSIYEIASGRGSKWKNIYRLNNPYLGAHYHGFYGAQNEDVYFSEITGSEHKHYNQIFERYEYPIWDCPLHINHYSDVRPYEFRLDRMIKSLIHQGHSKEKAESIAPLHPRVSLKDGKGFEFIEVKSPEFLKGKQ